MGDSSTGKNASVVLLRLDDSTDAFCHCTALSIGGICSPAAREDLDCACEPTHV